VDRSVRFELTLDVLSAIGLTTGGLILAGRRFGGAGFDVVDAVALAAVILGGIRQVALAAQRTRLQDAARRDHEALEVARLQRAEADSRYRVLVEHVPAAVYIDVADDGVSDGGRLAYMSPQISGILGYRPDEFVDDPELWPGLIHPDDRVAAIAAYNEHWRTGRPLRAEYRMLTRDGSEVWVRDEAYAMTDAPLDGRPVSQGLLIDTTDRKRLEAQLIHDALHDPLTGLANRVLFRDHLERALARRQRSRTGLALLFLDLDDFKVINDSYGHAAGDRVLVEVARRLSETVRAEDVAARQGGDEFTVLLATTHGADEAAASAQRLIEALAHPIDLGGYVIGVGVSIGIALAGGGGPVADDLLARADAAMYAAKAGGKGRQVLFDASMRVRAWSQLELETGIDRLSSTA
jgi:diguanylate cyclase (GGDEF)-like protein/PAS domain S-box-containing protein